MLSCPRLIEEEELLGGFKEENIVEEPIQLVAEVESTTTRQIKEPELSIVDILE
mgnify:CR=1 FL=1